MARPHIGNDEVVVFGRAVAVIRGTGESEVDGTFVHLTVTWLDALERTQSHTEALRAAARQLQDWYPGSVLPAGWPELGSGPGPIDPGPIDPPPPPPPSGPLPVRPLASQVYAQAFGPRNAGFTDNLGVRVVHGCTDFGGVVKFHEDRDRSLRQLDVVARYQQFIRAAWRLNGGLWTESGLTIDPIRDGWYDEALRGYLQACADRGIRVNLTCADMNNWTVAQAMESIRRVAQIAASVSPTVVWLHEWNELRGTWHPGNENNDQISVLRDMTSVWQQVYPWSLRALSDPGSQDKAGMERLSQPPANVAVIHNVRRRNPDAIRRAFNAVYENLPVVNGIPLPIVEGEPTGPEDPAPSGYFNRKVYQPTEDRHELFALYTMHVLTGQASTYFNDPALYSRRPLDETWGFKEIPTLWRAIDLPEDISTGRLIPGHKTDAPLRVVGSRADRADSAEIPGYTIGVISGDHGGWDVRSGRRGRLRLVNGDGVVHEGRIAEGERIPADGPSPVVVVITD